MNALLQDVRYALRLLAKSPGFTTVAVITLAIGIGANTAIFSLINAVLLRPLPGIAEADRLVAIGRTYRGQGFDNSSYPNYRDLRDQNTLFSDVAAIHPLSLSLSKDNRAARLMGAVVSPNYFRTLGVRFAAGRGFLDSEDLGSNAAPVVVLSYSAWKQRFGADNGIVGQVMAVNGHAMTVVGVAERGFRGNEVSLAVDAWVPMSAAALVLPSYLDLKEAAAQRDWVWIKLLARMKPGGSFAQANAEVQTIEARLRQYPENKDEHWRVAAGAGDPDDRQEMRQLTGMLLGVVALLLLLACANIANLVLAQATARKREVAVRSALGGARGRIIRHLLTESLLLACFGGITGLLFSFWAADVLPHLFPEYTGYAIAVELTPDWRVLAFTIGLTGLTGVLFGMAPALHCSRADLFATLKEGGIQSTRRLRLRPVLAAAQVTLSLVLLVAAGLLLRTIRNFNSIDAGFNPNHLVLMSVEPSLTGRYNEARLQSFYDQLLTRVSALPGVEAATLARIPPVSRSGWGVAASIPGKPGSVVEQHSFQYNTVAPNYFGTLGIAVVRGRGFTMQDAGGAPGVAVVNETAARTLWPGEDALGKTVQIKAEKLPRVVVGVARDLKYRSLREAPRPFLYLSMWQPYPLPDAPVTIHLRTRVPLAAIAGAVQREVQALDPTVPVFDAKTISEHMGDSYWRQRLAGTLVGIFAMLALLMGTVGIYAVVAYAVAERTHEFGIRMAIGARPGQVLRMVVADATRIAIAGVLVGLFGALAVTRVLKTLLYGVSPTDPETFAVVAALVAAVALAASYLPARRATQVDPMVALRYE